MNIDFPPPSNGIYNNAGSCQQLANYLEHEDMERMQQGIYTEGFFNLTDDNLYKAEVISEIDKNIGQLLKTDAKFYAIHVSPSEKELQRMGSTEQEQAEAMKLYIREVFIPEYSQNFNKGLSAEDIKFFGKIHFERERSEKALFLHCHLIVSCKDQSNKLKISPLTNHRNTKKGAIKGGFDRKTLFENVEKGFDKLFGYNRQLPETFEYCNTMKNGKIDEKLRMQEREIKGADTHLSTHNQTNSDFNNSVQQYDSESVQQYDSASIEKEVQISINQSSDKSVNQLISIPDLGLSSVLGIFTPEPNPEESGQPLKPKKKKRRKFGRQM